MPCNELKKNGEWKGLDKGFIHASVPRTRVPQAPIRHSYTHLN